MLTGRNQRPLTSSLLEHLCVSLLSCVTATEIHSQSTQGDSCLDILKYPLSRIIQLATN